MEFFTPDLLLRFNSPDDSVADAANDEWEAALVGYRTHLDALRERMSPTIQELSELNLHDAELLVFEEWTGRRQEGDLVWLGSPLGSVVTASVRLGDLIFTINYGLWRSARADAPREVWPFAMSKTHWLYDEIDVDNDMGQFAFIQRVLLSDGRVVEIPFLGVLIVRLPAHAPLEPLVISGIA